MEATYKSGRALAIAIVVLLTVMTMLMLAHEALHRLTMRQLGTFDADGAGARLALLSTLTWSAAVAQFATAVLFLMWVYRATANLPALGAGSTRFTPAGAVKVFFIPLVGWVRVYQVMAMIWTESQPRALTNADYSKSRSIYIVILWYAFLVGGLVVDSLLSCPAYCDGGGRRRAAVGVVRLQCGGGDLVRDHGVEGRCAAAGAGRESGATGKAAAGYGLGATLDLR